MAAQLAAEREVPFTEVAKFHGVEPHGRLSPSALSKHASPFQSTKPTSPARTNRWSQPESLEEASGKFFTGRVSPDLDGTRRQIHQQTQIHLNYAEARRASLGRR